MPILIKNIINDTDRKGYLRMIVELSYLLMKYRNVKDLKAYRTCLMYKRNAGKIDDYVLYRELMNIINNYFKRNDKDPILSNKIAFSEYLRTNEIPTAKFLGRIQNAVYYDEDNNSYSLDGEGPFLEVLRKIVKAHPSIFIKQIDAYGGKGVFRIDENDIEYIISRINLDHDYIIEETLTQHEMLSKINPSCINTLRVVTYRDGDDIYMPSSFLRMGVGKGYVDNASSGGIFISYDLESNVLGSTAYSLFEYGGVSHYHHPDSNFCFERKRLIYNNEIRSIIKKAALLFDRPVVGWDIAYTPDGPVIIEGNENPHIMMIQITCRGLLSNTIYRRMFKHI